MEKLNLTSVDFEHVIPVYCSSLAELGAQSHIAPALLDAAPRFVSSLADSVPAGLDPDLDGLRQLFAGVVSHYKNLVDNARYVADCVAVSSGAELGDMYTSLTSVIATKMVEECVSKITSMVLDSVTASDPRESFRTSTIEQQSSPAPAPSSSSSSSAAPSKLFDLQINTSSSRSSRSARRRKSSVLGMPSTTVYSFLARHMNKHPEAAFRRCCELRTMVVAIHAADTALHARYVQRAQKELAAAAHKWLSERSECKEGVSFCGGNRLAQKRASGGGAQMAERAKRVLRGRVLLRR
jgi:hypothetical protein